MTSGAAPFTFSSISVSRTERRTSSAVRFVARVGDLAVRARPRQSQIIDAEYGIADDSPQFGGAPIRRGDGVGPDHSFVFLQPTSGAFRPLLQSGDLPVDISETLVASGVQIIRILVNKKQRAFKEKPGKTRGQIHSEIGSLRA